MNKFIKCLVAVIMLVTTCTSIIDVFAEEDLDELEYIADLEEGSIIIINDKDGNKWQEIIVDGDMTINITYPIYEGWEFDYWQESWDQYGSLVLTPVYRQVEHPTVQTEYVEEAPIITETPVTTPSIEVIENDIESNDDKNIVQNLEEDVDDTKNGVPLILYVVGAGGIGVAALLIIIAIKSKNNQ